MSEELSRECKTCKVVKPLNKFHKYPKPQKKTGDTHTQVCRHCYYYKCIYGKIKVAPKPRKMKLPIEGVSTPRKMKLQRDYSNHKDKGEKYAVVEGYRVVREWVKEKKKLVSGFDLQEFDRQTELKAKKILATW